MKFYTIKMTASKTCVNQTSCFKVKHTAEYNMAPLYRKKREGGRACIANGILTYKNI